MQAVTSRLESIMCIVAALNAAHQVAVFSKLILSTNHLLRVAPSLRVMFSSMTMEIMLSGRAWLSRLVLLEMLSLKTILRFGTMRCLITNQLISKALQQTK
jgi:hypothetical protein